jgi:hypothetical protein
MKYQVIHSHWRFSFPERYLRQLSEARRNQWLFCEGGFRFSETTIHTPAERARELERYVESVRPCPEIVLQADRAWRQMKYLGTRVRRRILHAIEEARS